MDLVEFQAKHIVAQTGIKMSEFQYWVKLGLINPSVTGRLSQGKIRLFSLDDVNKVLKIKKYLEEGYRLEYIRRNANKFGL